jgi:hypothetical protein
VSGLAGGVLPGQGGALLDWADKTLGSGLGHVTRAAKNLLAGGRVAPLVAAVEALVEGKQVGGPTRGGGVLLRVLY